MGDTMKDEEEISRMLASLKTVDAPDDFEGGVRSRIAKRRESLSRPSLLLVAKFAFPMLLLLGIGGFLIVADSGPLKGDMVPPVSDEVRDVAAFDEPASDSPVGPSTNMNSGVAQIPVNRGGKDRAVQPDSQDRGSSREDQALSQDDTTVFPDGVDPRKARITNGPRPSGGQISLTSVLSTIGVSATCSSTGCVATDVREGSVAAKSGIRAGDQLVAFDQQPINSSTSLTGSLNVSSITLVRDGQRTVVWIGRR